MNCWHVLLWCVLWQCLIEITYHSTIIIHSYCLLVLIVMSFVFVTISPTWSTQFTVAVIDSFPIGTITLVSEVLKTDPVDSCTVYWAQHSAATEGAFQNNSTLPWENLHAESAHKGLDGPINNDNNLKTTWNNVQMYAVFPTFDIYINAL